MQSMDCTFDDAMVCYKAATHLHQVEGCDGSCVNSRQVPEGLGNAIVIAIDHQRTLAVHIAPVPHLSLAPPDIL